MSTVQEIADRLYALPPSQFVAERDAAAATARAEGDAATVAALRKLRRPTVAAWLVNLLALRRPEALADLTELADALRRAQQDLDGVRLRELTGRRRGVVSTLVGQAQALAREVAPELTGKLPLAEVESTLGAALVDRDAAAQVRSGRLVRAAVPAGFGELPQARLRLVTSAPETVPAGPGEPDTEAIPDRAEVARELDQARAALSRARAGLEVATAAERAAQEELARIDAEIAELTARRTAAADRVASGAAVSLDARRAVSAARRRVGEVEAVLARLDEPRPS